MSAHENQVQPVLRARGLMKRYGTVVAMNGTDFDLYPNEVLGVIGDNGAGKTTLIRAISGATTPDHGIIELDGKEVHFNTPQDARNAGIETVYQNLALSPALSIADNMFLGREIRKSGILGSLFRKLDHKRWRHSPAINFRNWAFLPSKHQSDSRNAVRWSTSGRSCGARCRIWFQGGYNGRANGCFRRKGIPPCT